MIPLHLAVPVLAACAAIGWGIDVALGRPLEAHGPLAWVVRALAGLVAGLAIVLHPLAALALAGLVVLAARVRRDASGPPGPSSAPDVRSARSLEVRAALACVAGVAVVAWARPAVPLAWDEHVWLAKVRLGTALRAAALDPEGDVIPRGYPILASLAQAALALFRTDLAAVVAGAAALTILAVALAVTTLPAERRIPWVLALAAAPLAWIHARSAYLDLVVGLLAVAVLAGLLRARDGDRGGAVVAVLAAFLLAGTKDEGAAHVLAIALACAITSRDRRAPALAVTAALACAGTWRVLLAMAGVANRDHAIDGVGLHDTLAITGELVRGATDLRSWGAAWPLAIAASIGVLWRGDVRPRTVAISLVLSAAALVTGVLVGSERLRVFALDGTLVNRLLMQLLPLAGWTVLEAIASSTRDAPGRAA